MNTSTWVWRAVLARLLCDADAYTRLVAEADDGQHWREVSERLLDLLTDELVVRWRGDLDGLVEHVERLLTHALDAAARDAGQWAP